MDFVDLTFVPLLEKKYRIKSRKLKVILFCVTPIQMPVTTLKKMRNVMEVLLDKQRKAGFSCQIWMRRAATRPMLHPQERGRATQGCLYSHRSTVLHALSSISKDTLACLRHLVLPVVPMFHVNAWGTPYAAAITGAKQVWQEQVWMAHPFELIKTKRSIYYWAPRCG